MVTLILTRIVFVLSIPLCLYAVYFGVVALFGLRKKLPAAPQAKPEKRFALVVAARNEAAVIGHLVDSLYGQDYPRELYEVIVAPNNCTDDTEAVAAGRGARIFRPEGVIRSKGEVLTRLNATRLRKFVYFFTLFNVVLEVERVIALMQVRGQLLLDGLRLNEGLTRTDWTCLLMLIFLTEVFALAVKLKEEQELTI